MASKANNDHIGGNIMASRKTTHNRLSLLAGSSLVGATIAAAAFAGVALTPATALAANECGDPNANGAGNDFFTCSGTLSSIVYASTNGNLNLTVADNLIVTSGGIAVNGGAGSLTINPGFTAAADVTGPLSFQNTGSVTLNVGTSQWHLVGASTFGGGGGAATLTVESRTNGANSGFIGTNAGGAATSFDFGAGVDTFRQGGTLAIGEGEEAAATLTITGLETWDNLGSVLFGVNPDLVTQYGRPVASDGVANDRIVAHGTAFTGGTYSAGSNSSTTLFLMDVDFSADQLDCSAAVTADCLDLRGGSAAGTTPIRLTTAGTGFAERLVLVDVSGAGASEATAFTLDPESEGYRDFGDGGAVESGLFLYSLQFDEDAEQYALVASEFSGRSLEIARVARGVTEPWRTATGTWHTRQLDLRDAVAAGDADAVPGVWLKLAGTFVEETGYDNSPAGFEYDMSADQRTTALVGGVDLMRQADGNAAFVIGVTAGKLDSELDFTGAEGDVQMDGHSLGAYASFVTGRFFVDGIVNRTSMDVTLRDMGDDFDTSATALGYQLEGGYRAFQFGDEGGAFIEPLAALSYVKTDIDDLSFGPVIAQLEGESLRGALGLRLGGGLPAANMIAKFSFTGRVWREFQGENMTALDTTFTDTTLIDQAPETLGDVGVQLGLFTLGHRASINVSSGVRFAEDYLSTDAAISFRMQW